MNGATHFAIAVGKETMRMILAVIAGLTKFWPSPPNICLTTTIATILPIAAIHKGRVDGRLSASIRPVTTAERSPSVPGRFMAFLERYSARTAVPTVVAVSASAFVPK